MDDAQKWARRLHADGAADYGWPERPLDLERTAVILGNAMAGEKHYLTVAAHHRSPSSRASSSDAPSFAAPAGGRARGDRRASCTRTSTAWLPEITEDTMPGELGNCIAGRIANLFNLHGPNFIADAACASAMAAMDAADRRAARSTSSTP